MAEEVNDVKAELPWWFRLVAVCLMALLTSTVAYLLAEGRELKQTKVFCATLHELGRYETKVEAGRCWVNLSDETYPMWIPSEWMNVA